MYVVKEFLECHITGNVEVQLCPGWTRETASKLDPGSIKKSFISISDAKRWIETQLTMAYQLEVIRYIKHCEHVMINSQKNYQHKLDALSQCLSLIKEIQTQSNRLPMAKSVLVFQKFLEEILPHSANPSHNSSQSTLFQIINYAKEIDHHARTRQRAA